MTTIAASAPARADFLNTHQDYKGLPVVPVALDLRLYLDAELTNAASIYIKSEDLEKYNEPAQDLIRIREAEILQKGFFGNYFRAVLKVIGARGQLHKVRGLSIVVKSEIPIGSGLASSAALEVSFVALLNRAFDLGYSKRDVAETAFLAENRELNTACGRLDQYGVTFGGITKLDCRPPYEVESLPFSELLFAVIDSGIRHSTSDIHPKRQAEINRGLEVLMTQVKLPPGLRAKLAYGFDRPKWDEITEAEISDFLSTIDHDASRRILFTIRMNRLTEFALRVLRGQATTERDASSNLGAEEMEELQRSPIEERPYLILGRVMNQQHALLRDLYDVSLPKIDDIQTAALAAGAYGAKISGAGMGGSLVALVKNQKCGANVVEACLSAGARNGWVSMVAEGARA